MYMVQIPIHNNNNENNNNNNYISQPMIAVLSDIIEVIKTEPEAKFLIFPQSYPIL